MSTLVAGRVAITPEGDWLNSLPYKRLSLVKYNDHLYVSKKDSPAGTLPTNDTYWMDCGNMDISVATVYIAGKVKPDGETITIDEDGTIHSIATGSANLIEISEEDYYNTLTPEEQEDPDVAYFVYDGEVPDVIVVDGAMSDISSNPVQNRVIKKYIDEHSSQVEELTQAEYDALPDSKNSDGTLRVIKDVPVSNAVATADKIKYGNGNVKIALDGLLSDAGGTIRYNAETDTIQIKDSDGVWHDFISGGLTKIDLRDVSLWSAYSGTSYSGYSAALCSLSSSDGSLKVSYSNPVNTMHGISIITNNKISITGHKKLKISLTHVSDSPSVTGAKLTFVAAKESSLQPVKAYVITSGVNVSPVKSFEFDISDVSGEYFIAFEVCQQWQSGVTSIISAISVE